MPIVEYQGGRYGYQPPAFQGAYPKDALPPLIGDAVVEVSTNHGVPIELAAHAALATTSLVGQIFANVQCPNFPPAPCALFLLAISKSSGGKSQVEQRFLRAVRAFELRSKEEAVAGEPDFRARTKIWRDDDRRLSKEYLDARPGTEESRLIQELRLQHEKGKPTQPLARELRFADLTPQALRDMLVVHGTLGILSPEAGPAMNGSTFSQPAMLSGYWSGEDRPVALVSGNRRAVSPRLTISVVLQEHQFLAYMKSRADEAFGTGLLARFLPAFPMSFDSPGRQTRVEDAPEPKLDLFNERVANILNQPVPAPSERKSLQLTEEARFCWKLFTEAVHNELICGPYSENVKSFFRKLGEQAARIAALFHYFDGQPGDISPDAMKRAIVLCEWYSNEFIRSYSRFAPSPQQKVGEAAQKLLEWLQDASTNALRYSKLTPGCYTERDLTNYSPIRRDPELLGVAINVLESQGHIATRPGRKGGRIVYYPPYMAQPFQQGGFGVQPMPYHTARPFIAPSSMSSTWPTHANHGVNNQFGVSNMPLNNSPNRGFAQFDTIQAYQGENAASISRPQSWQSNVEPEESPVMTMEYDSEELRAVKRHIEQRAIEAGLGPVTLSVEHRRG